MSAKRCLVFSGFLGFFAVALGAFGAHALKGIYLSPEEVGTFETGIRYQFYHSLALGITGLCMKSFGSRYFSWAAWSWVWGIFLFSGSLYALTLTNVRFMGVVTPFGGLFFLAGWVFFLTAVSSSEC